MRFGYIEPGGVRAGIDESAFNTFFNYYGDFINDDVIPGGGYRTALVRYAHAFNPELTALLSLERGGDEDTDGGTVIRGYPPYTIVGLKYKRERSEITMAAAYDAVNKRWLETARFDLDVTDRLHVWLMGACKDMADKYYREIDDPDSRITDGSRGTRRINSFYGKWGGHRAVWSGLSCAFSHRMTANPGLSLESSGNLYSAANISYQLSEGLSLIPANRLHPVE